MQCSIIFHLEQIKISFFSSNYGVFGNFNFAIVFVSWKSLIFAINQHFLKPSQWKMSHQWSSRFKTSCEWHTSIRVWKFHDSDWQRSGGQAYYNTKIAELERSEAVWARVTNGGKNKISKTKNPDFLYRKNYKMLSLIKVLATLAY